MKKAIVLFFIWIIVLSFSSCKKSVEDAVEVNPTDHNLPTELLHEQNSYEDEPALILAAESFNGVFSPFFGISGTDLDISGMVQERLIGFDRNAQPDQSGLADYMPPEEIRDSSGNIIKTIFTFRLKEGLVFSDGTPITAEDVLFSYYVLCDPNYTGASSIYTMPIVGVNEYRYDDPDYLASLAEIQQAADTYIPEEAEIEVVAENLASLYAEFGVVKEDFLMGGLYYETDTLPELLVKKYTEDETAYIQKNLSDGVELVPQIEGIQKIDERTVEVTLNGFDPLAIYNIGDIAIAPKHYYGDGFTKGNLETVKSKNQIPMGAGPYRFVTFENNVVTLIANDYYYKGAPITKKIKYQVVDTSNQLEGVRLGYYDIATPTASMDMVAEVEKIPNIHYELIDNLGYGYIGLSALRLPDLNVRKGIMHLMDRQPAIQAYYGDLASVVERPMSKVSWAYPKEATEYYGFDPEKAMEYFQDSGYEMIDGKLMKDGMQMSLDIGIGADGIGDHPSYLIVLGIKSEGEKLGLNVNIVDYADGNLLYQDMMSGKLDLWCAAWDQENPDPDLYQIYHSEGPDNYYGLQDEELDQIIMEARNSGDIEFRKELYAEALDIVMENAVEMPVYQRKNMIIFNQDVIDVGTLPKDMTPYYMYLAEVEKLELKLK